MRVTMDAIARLLNKETFKTRLLKYEEDIKVNLIQEVTSTVIFEPNTKSFHPQGLFSESIFGPLTDLSRFTTEGYIDLHTKIIHPVVFRELISKKKFYTGILSGNKYATFNKDSFEFELAQPEDKGASTGFEFFMKYINQLHKADKPKSLTAANKHKMMQLYKTNLSTSKFLVIPAGLRDIDMKSARLAQDDINKIYLQILNFASGLSDHELSSDSLFDSIRYNIQLRVDEIYKHIFNMLSGKEGFLEKHYGSRKVVQGTRNVISMVPQSSKGPGDITNLKVDETLVPLLNTIKAFQPFFVKYIIRDLYNESIPNDAVENVSLIDPKTLNTTYTSVTPVELRKYTTNKSVVGLINKFRHVAFRESPVSIKGSDNKLYYLLLTYKIDDKVFIGKNADELKSIVLQYEETFDSAKLAPLTWVEAMYIAAMTITPDKHMFITRYPVIEDGSIYPSKVQVASTEPSLTCKLHYGSKLMTLPRYPILGNTYPEALGLSTSRLQGLGADMDGDTVSGTGIWAKDSNAELSKHLNSLSAVITDTMKLKISTNSDVLNLITHNLSK